MIRAAPGLAGRRNRGPRGGQLPSPAGRILTSHAGSLPRPEDLIEANGRRAAGGFTDEPGYQAELGAAVADVVARQRAAGVDVVNDGEYGHSMGQRYDYGSWWTYQFRRLGGLELVSAGAEQARPAGARPGEVVLGSFDNRRDWLAFSQAYGDPSSGAMLPGRSARTAFPVCRGPITYRGHDAVRADITHLRAALDAAGITDGFLNAVAPASASRFGNEFYGTDEELLWAYADALREEYRDQINPAPTCRARAGIPARSSRR